MKFAQCPQDPVKYGSFFQRYSCSIGFDAVALTLTTHKAMTSPVRIKSLMSNLRVFSLVVQL
ncbi:MAG: hypothetical protein IH886_16585 [Nitrospinae bacterium]|nr:hypothetical protein [Nitrospinota bacterium]